MTENASESRAVAAVGDLIRAGHPLVYLLTPEESRVDSLLEDIGRSFFQPAAPLLRWTATEGIRGANGAAEETTEPRAALDHIIAHPGPALFHLKDFHEPLRQSPVVRRRLRDLYSACLDTGKFVFISSSVRYIPEELQRDIALLELDRPDLPELLRFLEREDRELEKTGARIEPDPGVRLQLARALLGLTMDESRHALRRAAAAQKTIDSSSVPHLLEEKHLIIKKTGVIEYVTSTVPLDDVGGISNMKKWLLERRRLFEMRDDISAEIVPKGILIMGVSGCGKSLAIKSIASCFDLPLYRIDMVQTFSGRYGSPESVFASTCRTLEEMAPAVMWLDEIEMAVSSRVDDAAGMLGRIFAFFLTWMQEKARGLFVAATANRIDLLPAEMIRKGRFDEIFFVDLPGEEERMEIFRIHLRKRGMDPEPLDLDRLRQFTRGWTGAEIEQCVVSALTGARLADRELLGDDLLNMTAKIVPLSKTMKEQVDHIRAWALDRAVRAAPRSREGG